LCKVMLGQDKEILKGYSKQPVCKRGGLAAMRF